MGKQWMYQESFSDWMPHPHPLPPYFLACLIKISSFYIPFLPLWRLQLGPDINPFPVKRERRPIYYLLFLLSHIFYPQRISSGYWFSPFLVWRGREIKKSWSNFHFLRLKTGCKFKSTGIYFFFKKRESRVSHISYPFLRVAQKESMTAALLWRRWFH